jgi:hypothetical protein
MKSFHKNGKLTIDLISNENGQPLQLTYDTDNDVWHGVFPKIQFGKQIFTDVEILIENNDIHITANALIGGISLTFEYDSSEVSFKSEEKINIIHINADHIHTLSDFVIKQNGQVSALLVHDHLHDQNNNNIRLIYNEPIDMWESDEIFDIRYHLCSFRKAKVYLNDYDFVIKGMAPFSDNVIEFSFGKKNHKEVYFRSADICWQIGNYKFQKATIIFHTSGQFEARGNLNLFNQQIDFIYKKGKMYGTTEVIKKYPSPEKGCFETKKSYTIHLHYECSLDIFNSKRMDIETVVKVTNPFVVHLQNKSINTFPKTVSLVKDLEDGKYKAEVPKQTVMYKGLAKNGFLGEYYFEESKKYMYDPESEILTVGTKFLQAHGKLFYRRVYNYYYKNFEQYSIVKGFWPFRRLEYQYYYQMISHMV